MRFNKNKSYKCVLCKRPSNTLHEIFFGSANKKISIVYNLQVPLCNDCHVWAHGKSKIEYQMLFCRKLRIFYSLTRRMINNFKENKEYFEGIKDKCLEKIKSWEM